MAGKANMVVVVHKLVGSSGEEGPEGRVLGADAVRRVREGRGTEVHVRDGGVRTSRDYVSLTC